MRLIDADALTRRAVEKLYITNSFKAITDLIDQAPTIEPSGDSGVFIPGISVEQLRNAPLEGVEELLAKGVMRDVLEPSGDLVSRQLLIGAIEKCGEEKIYPQALIQTIKALPSAEAAQGEWVDIDNYYRMATCSHCHKVAMFEKWGEYTKPYDFCPNCGADMRKDQDR